MIEEQSAPDSDALCIECPTCGVGATAYVEGHPSLARPRRGSRFEIGDTAPVLGVCADCGYGLILDPALYTISPRRAA